MTPLNSLNSAKPLNQEMVKVFRLRLRTFQGEALILSQLVQFWCCSSFQYLALVFLPLCGTVAFILFIRHNHSAQPLLMAF